jgi:ribosome-associated protein
MEEDLRVREGIVIPGAELSMTASRSPGPGGQHVNKTSTRVTLIWDASSTRALTARQRARVVARLSSRIGRDGTLKLHVSDTRSQARNRALARERLAGLVDEALRVRRPRMPTRAPATAVRRRVEGKKRRGQLKKLRSRPSGDD